MSSRSTSIDPIAKTWHLLPPGASYQIGATCCGVSEFEIVTRGVYADKLVLEAKSLLRCSHCRQTWLLTGQARPYQELADVTHPT